MTTPTLTNPAMCGREVQPRPELNYLPVVPKYFAEPVHQVLLRGLAIYGLDPSARYLVVGGAKISASAFQETLTGELFELRVPVRVNDSMDLVHVL